MMFRMLLITILIGLACANPQNSQNHPQRHHHGRPAVRKSHHYVALDELIKRKPAMKFLGRGFIQRALAAQGEKKFLKLNGKEERDLNGTISIDKQNVLVDLVESKDGHFMVQNQKKRVVGRVDVHAGSNKHFAMHKTKTGDNLINGYRYGNAQLSLEQDIAGHKGLHGRKAAPTRHMSLRVYQSHNTHGQAYIHDIKPETTTEEQQTQRYRFRRQANSPVQSACIDQDCASAVQI